MPTIQTEAGVLPFPSHFASVSGYRMHYLDEGQGPVVVCLHGNPTWCYYYRNLIKILSDSFRVIAPDFLGCGLSDRTPGVHFKAEDRIKQVEEFVDSLKLEKFSLVLHDWGGPIGTAFATRHADKIEKIVYLNTTLTETESLPLIIKWSAAPVIGKILTQYTKRFLHFTTGLGVAKRLPHDIVKRYHFPYRTSRDREAIWDFVQDIPFDSSHPTYATMFEMASKLELLRSKPIKIIWGLQDPCFHPGLLSKVIAHYPDAEVMELPKASHLVLEDGAEAALPAIKEFLLRGKKKDLSENEERDAKTGRVNTLIENFFRLAKENHKERIAITARQEMLGGGELQCRYVSRNELAQTIRQYERGLASLGLSPGDRILMLVPPGIEFLALAFAVMGRGGTPVFVDPGVGREKMLKCIKDASPHAFIGSAKAHLIKLLDRELFKRLKFSVLAETIFIPGRPSLSLFKRFSPQPLPPVMLPSQLDKSGRNKHPAMIAFTSGATGTPKGVIFTNEMLEAELEIFHKYFELGPGVVDLPLLGVFSLFNTALGVTSVFTPLKSGKPLSLSPKFLIQVIKELSVKTSFGAPTLWNKISEYCLRVGQTLPEMERVFMAGAPVSESVKNLVKKVLPNARLFTPYGATEALPVTLGEITTLENPVPASSGESGICVGKPLDHVSVRITELNSSAVKAGVLPESLVPGMVGEIFVSGSSVSPEYLHRPDANQASKIPDKDGNIWHRIGDIGYQDAEGRIYFCGRVVDTVQFEGRNLYTYPVEELFNQVKKVKRTALVSTEGGKVPVVVVEPLPQSWPDTEQAERDFADELRLQAESHPMTQGISHFEFIKALPVDPRHNAKIQRDELREWVTKKFHTRRAA